MNRRKINQEDVQPQEDTVVFYTSRKRNDHSLLPESKRPKRKGNPISVPCQSSLPPRRTGVSIEKSKIHTLFDAPPSRSPIISKLKTAEESLQRSISKPHGFGKAPTTLSNDDEDRRRNNLNVFNTFKNRNSHIKKQQPHHIYTGSMFGPFAIGRSSSLSTSSPPTSSNSITNTSSKSLSKKQKALGVGRSPHSSQSHDSLALPTKVPYSFSQNHRRNDIHRALPYWREQREQQVNQHRRFESSSDEASVVNNEPRKKKKKRPVTTTSHDIATSSPIDISDNDEIYHSACSTPSDAKNINSNDNNHHKTPTDRILRQQGIKEQLASPRNFINKMDVKQRSSNLMTAEHEQGLSSTPLPFLSPSPSSPSSPSSSTSTTKELRVRTKDKKSSAPVELSDDEMVGANDILFTYPINRSKGSITITVEDQKRLEVNQYLNDSIIAFYLKYLMDSYSTSNGYRNCNSKTRAATENTHIFSSFFYNRLTQGGGVDVLKKKTISYENVRKWTSKIDLFSKKYAIFPINENWHWYLVLVCNIDKCIPEQTSVDPSAITTACERPHIFILDSLGGTQQSTMSNINRYLLMEAQHRRNIDPSDFIQPKTHYARVPKQDNSCDCGVFLLHFVDQFLDSPQNFIQILLKRDEHHTKWKQGEIKEKRTELKSLFKKIHHDYSLEHGSEMTS